MVYVEWYTAFTKDPNPHTLLFKVSPLKERDGGRICSIIPLANIQQSVHLMLKRNKYIGILSIAVTTLQYITISMITIFSMYITHVR